MPKQGKQRSKQPNQPRHAPETAHDTEATVAAPSADEPPPADDEPPPAPAPAPPPASEKEPPDAATDATTTSTAPADDKQPVSMESQQLADAAPSATADDEEAMPEQRPARSASMDSTASMDAAAEEMLQRFEVEQASSPRREPPTPTPPEDGPPSYNPLEDALAQMRTLVSRAEGLAELHAELADDDQPWPPAGPARPPPALPAPLEAGGPRYVCLDDGALVEADALLQGPRRGADYLTLEEADAQCRTALAVAEDGLSLKAAAARSLAEAAAAVVPAWESWTERASKAVDAGFAQLQTVSWPLPRERRPHRPRNLICAHAAHATHAAHAAHPAHAAHAAATHHHPTTHQHATAVHHHHPAAHQHPAAHHHPTRAGPRRAAQRGAHRHAAPARRGRATRCQRRRSSARYLPLSLPAAPSAPGAPGVAWHGLACLGLAWPGLAWLGLAWPGLIWPGLAWPGLAWLGVTWLGLA